jgi:2-dehydropantoate 2-reductase
MRILVFGAGAIGSLLGHRLSRAGHDVALVARTAYVNAVRERGLRLCENGQTLANGEVGSPVPVSTEPADPARGPELACAAVYPEAVESIERLPAEQRIWDLVLLTVKAYDTRSAAQALAPYVQSQVPLLIIQNGVGGEDLVREVLADAPLISGVITLSVSVIGPACVRLETTRGGLNLARVTEGQPLDRWEALFREAGLRTVIYADYRAMKWSKLLLNIQANAIPAILDMTPGRVYADPALFAVERAAFLEAVAVMRALGLSPVGFSGYPVSLLVKAMQVLPSPILRLVLTRLVASGRGDKRPSLHMDLASGRRHSEVLYLNGAVAMHAQQTGVAAPVNRLLVDTLTSIAAGRQDWDDFRYRPDRLLAMLTVSGR